MSVSLIVSTTAQHFGIEVTDLVGPSRLRRFCRPRQIAMYIAAKDGRQSISGIARRIGGRDHTTVMHGRDTIERLMVDDDEMRRDIRVIRAAIPLLKERQMGGVFRHHRADQITFKSRRTTQENQND